MKKIIIIFLLISMAVIIYWQLTDAKENYNSAKSKEDSITAESIQKSETKTVDDISEESIGKAPDFTLTSTDEKQIKLSDYKGKIVILDFWATWCAPCRKGIPDLVEIQKEYKDNVVIVGISLDKQSTKNFVIPFMKEFGINYPVVYGNGKVVADYGYIQAIPTSFIIDRKGNIVDGFVGLVTKDAYTNRIISLLERES